MVFTGKAQLWILRDYETDEAKLVILTRILHFPRVKGLDTIISAGRDLLENMELVQVIEQWAAAEGCEVSVIQSRLGGRKVLQKVGYKLQHASFIKSITYMNEDLN